MRTGLVLLVVVAAGCEETKAVVPRYEGPMPVTYGDCAGPAVAWVSGPRPAAFTSAEADETGGSPTTADVKPPAEDATLGRGRTEQGVGTQPPKDTSKQPRNVDVLGSTAPIQGGAFASLTDKVSSPFDDTDIEGGLLGNEAGEMNGGFGFGRSGFGPGGGPNGWVTGRHGSGHSGPIGMTRRHMAEPTVEVGQPIAQGNLDKAIIRRYIKRNLPRIRYCYEKALLGNNRIAGTVIAKFFITPNGDVATSSATGMDPNVATCVADIVKNIEFPKPKGGGGVQVRYPFTFQNPGAATAKTAKTTAAGSTAGAGSGSAANTGSATAGSADAGSGSDSGSAQTTVANRPRPSNRRLFRAPGPVEAAYKPGASNPLRVEDAALVECFRKTPMHFGTAVFELAYDAAGTVKTATVHGVDDKALVTCVTAVARRVKRASPAATAERCSVAFGEMPIASLPTLDITADAIALYGRILADPRTVSTADGPSAKIPAVSDAITARVAAVTARSVPVVALHGPLVVRPVDAAPMKVVVSVLGSILGSGDDFVLAMQTGTGWSLLAPIAVPVVPVPFGTGSVWNPVKGRSRSAGTAVDENRVGLSILITKDAIWLGLSRVNELIEVKRDDKGASVLQTELAKQKAGAFFADRADIEIAAEDAVIYADYIGVVKAAVAAGFVDWRLTSPSGLAVRPQL